MARVRQDLRVRIPSISCVSQGAIVEEGLGGGGGEWGADFVLAECAPPPPPPPPPPMKGVWCSGCHRPRINQGGAPEMGLIKVMGKRFP